MTDMTIGKVADVVGVGVETIRFYERRKLIEQPPRPREGGYRIYSDTTVKRLHFIRRAQELGFSLREIAELLALRDAESNQADASDVRQRAMAKLHDVDQKIEQLRRIRQGLAALVDCCPGQGPLQCCSIFDALEQNAGPTGGPIISEETDMQTIRL
jgi:MerR family transcriptional regulator, copper efflux regulator